ncbi:MAG: hypothetical protein H7270_11180 [Dermatophilaceae bacterium]|nr:hypothetical protein [Dermatophilaceae bacterium]
MLEVDPVASVRGRSGSNVGFVLGQYVNDRPHVASFLLSVAMGKVFRSELNGRCAQDVKAAGLWESAAPSIASARRCGS